MDLFKYTKRIIDKVVGASKLHAVQKNAGELLDPMQKYLTVGSTMSMLATPRLTAGRYLDGLPR